MRRDGLSRSPHLGVPVRVAVVGAGQFGELHAHAFAANPDCVLTAIVDPNLERARGVAERAGAATVHESIEQLLRTDRIDAASIVTAGGHHLQPALAALEAGASVLLEKPVVMNNEEGRMLRAAVETARGFVMPAHILRFAAPYQELRHRLRSGAIGDPRALSFRRHRTTDHDNRFSDVHPVLMTMVHDIDLALWLTADVPARVSARQVELPDRAQPLAVWAEAETERGAVWSFQVSWSLGQGGVLPDALEIVGEAGALALSLGTRVHDLGANASPVDDALTPDGGHGALREEIRAFVDGVRFATAPQSVTLEDALVGIQIGQDIIAAAQDQGPVEN